MNTEQKIEKDIMNILKEYSTFVDGQVKGLIVHGAIEKIKDYIIAGRSAGLEREKEKDDEITAMFNHILKLEKREKELEDALKYNAYAIWKGISSDQSFEEWNIEFLKRFNLNK